MADPKMQLLQEAEKCLKEYETTTKQKDLQIEKLKKELVEATSKIATITSELETVRAKNKSDSETIKIQQGKIETVSSKCAAFKMNTKKCQDEFMEKERELNALRRDMADEMDMMRQQVSSIISQKSIIHSDISSSENEDPTAKKCATMQ